MYQDISKVMRETKQHELRHEADALEKAGAAWKEYAEALRRAADSLDSKEKAKEQAFTRGYRAAWLRVMQSALSELGHSSEYELYSAVSELECAKRTARLVSEGLGIEIKSDNLEDMITNLGRRI